MNAPVLDTLRCAQTLKTAGFREEQAEAMAQVLGDALADVATKADLDNAIGGLKTELKADIAQLDAKIDNAEARLETKIEAVNQRIESLEASVNQRFDSFEASTQRQFDGVQRQLGSFADQLKFQARVIYTVGGILVALVLGSLVAPHLSWDTQPNPTESAAAEGHSAPAQTRPSAQPLVSPTESPPPPPST